MAEEAKKGEGGNGGSNGNSVPSPRLKDKYFKEVQSKLMDQFKYSNSLATPRVAKVCLNSGVGRAATDNNPRVLEQCLKDLTTISGQKAVVTKAKKSVSNFKVREGMKIGCRVTLRGALMYEFLDRLFNVAMPRIRDFRGIGNKIFDGTGNCSLGITEHTIFPEVDADKAESIHGLDITIVTTAKSDDEGFALLKGLGLPFKD